ncbi:MAG: EscU/YscU/HrcU family type III secretion system export apparatus switch protein [Planctomycetes bacterium]|nr:EscU/YscU/HrcU family type III secretion system export apparatus switch protein [Planctomycetota bacterium]MBI3843055.1 EscU/YscU/HrcU family type III secretion system export apparatus switch protein [Planctomycetota bacterium]
MAEGDFGERTEPATGKKRFDAKERGEVLRSQEVMRAVELAAGVALLLTYGPTVIDALKDLVRNGLTRIAHPELGAIGATALTTSAIRVTLIASLPFALAVSACGMLANYMQTGFMVSAKRISFDVGKLDPTKGLQRLISFDSVGRTIASLLKLAAVAAVVWSAVAPRLPSLANPTARDFDGTLHVAWEFITVLLVRTTIAFLVIAFLDFMFQRWQYEKRLKMSRHEIKEEMRQSEGDPTVRRRQRARQREIARRRMMSDVKTADVVITNPVRLAIALQYDKARMAAPRVVAKGMGHVARRIRQLARQHGIPVVESPALARVLYRLVSVGGEVPVTMYRAVAEILATLYRVRNSRSRRESVAS